MPILSDEQVLDVLKQMRQENISVIGLRRKIGGGCWKRYSRLIDVHNGKTTLAKHQASKRGTSKTKYSQEEAFYTIDRLIDTGGFKLHEITLSRIRTMLGGSHKRAESILQQYKGTKYGKR